MAIIVKNKEKISPFSLIENLILAGYERDSNLESGQYFNIGDTLRVYPVNSESIIRIDFFADEIEKITTESKNREKIKEFEISNNFIELEDNSKILPHNYIVHLDHGIGIFRRIETRDVLGLMKQYIVIEYLNNEFLYTPKKDIDKILPYIGVGKRKPKMNKLGSGVWSRTKNRTYRSVLSLARELLEVYAKRELKKSPRYQINSEWDFEVRKSFGFDETPDQNNALNDVYQDLHSNKPMDRLICGDVGFGKSEIAFRAAVQAIANGYQASLLCPTTILAQQHYANIKKRIDSLPINLVLLSRFVEDRINRKTISDIKQGKADFIIGTHKLLNKNINYKNLGLLIIDEEQKFGVRQKEMLKKEREEINVLTLSATPIPRTLFIAMSGIRDISQINTPPVGRKSINTRLIRYDHRIINKYIKNELNRNGQVYYIYNKVRTIEAKRLEIKKRFPAYKVEVAHGQMDKKKLAQVMIEFADGKIDILVCSTIIASGIDLPNVNTLIIEDADKFGLSQLYQMRGRVGRGSVSAFCLLVYNNKVITVTAQNRLNSLIAYSDLGSGINIALADLEIRGGGNILGREQHGNMEAVGLSLYSKLLKKAVNRLKN